MIARYLEIVMYRLTLTIATLSVAAAAPAIAQTPTPAAQQPPTTTARPATNPPGTAAPTTSPPGTTTPAAPAPAGTPTAASPAGQPANPAVGGAPMDATKTIVANAATAPNLTTLVKAVKAAGLDTTLAGPGPFTVFAPTNDAFGRVAPGTVDMLLKPENKATLIKLLTYHVVAGVITLEQLKAQIVAGGGKATLTTVEGSTLTAALEAGGALSLTDSTGTNKAYLEIPDVRQSNGIVHVINGVVSPKLG